MTDLLYADCLCNLCFFFLVHGMFSYSDHYQKTKKENNGANTLFYQCNPGTWILFFIEKIQKYSDFQPNMGSRAYVSSINFIYNAQLKPGRFKRVIEKHHHYEFLGTPKGYK
jgi:hypothetical protein